MDSLPAGDQPIDLKEAAKFLPKRNGRKPHVRTIERWIRHGNKGVRLEGFQFGATLATTREAILRFGKELLAAKSAKTPTAKEPTKRAERAGKALARIGVGRKKKS